MRFWLLLIVALATISRRASAAEVVLVHPDGADPFVEEVFHRVRGELHVQNIAFEQAEGSASEPSAAASQALLEHNEARACILFGWRGETTVIRVWVIEAPSMAPTLLEAVALQRNAEAPTLLAARAVALLSSAFRRAAAPPTEKPANPAQRELFAPQPPLNPRTWSLGAGLSELGFPSRSGAAFGPQIAVLERLSARLGLGLYVAAPLLGAGFENLEASARLVQGLAVLKIEAELLRFGPMTLHLDGGGGVHFLHATGSVAEGVGSLAPRRDLRFTPGVVAGLQSAWNLSPRFSLVLGADAVVLLPPTRVAVGTEVIRLPEPALELSTLLRVAL